MAGPESPRWVNSRSSWKAMRFLPWPVAIRTGSDTPESAAQGCHWAASKVSGTSAGRGATSGMPNCRAMR